MMTARHYFVRPTTKITRETRRGREREKRKMVEGEVRKLSRQPVEPATGGEGSTGGWGGRKGGGSRVSKRGF